MGDLVQIFKLMPVHSLIWTRPDCHISWLTKTNTVSKFRKLMMDEKVPTVQIRSERVWLTCGRYVLLDQVLPYCGRTCGGGRAPPHPKKLIQSYLL